jgi:hypothetical protein
LQQAGVAVDDATAMRQAEPQQQAPAGTLPQIKTGSSKHATILRDPLQPIR